MILPKCSSNAPYWAICRILFCVHENDYLGIEINKHLVLLEYNKTVTVFDLITAQCA